MGYCPLLREECKAADCAFWLHHVKKCALHQIGAWSASTFIEGGPPEGLEGGDYFEERKKRIDGILSKIKGISVDDLSRELTEFAQKECPNVERIPEEIKTLFWTGKGITRDMFFENYELELIKEQVEAKADLRLMLTSEESLREHYGEIESRLMVQEHPSISEEKPLSISKELMEGSIEELAKRLVEFINKEFPEVLSHKGYPYEAVQMLFDMFWHEHGIPNRYAISDPRLKLKIIKVEMKAKELLENLKISQVSTQLDEAPLQNIKDKEPQDIANDMLKFAEEKLKENASIYLTMPLYTLSSELEKEWFEAKKISLTEIRHVKPEIWDKLERSKQLFWMKLHELYNHLRIDEEKRRCEALVEKALNWMRQRGMTSITKSRLKSFLMEEGVTLSTRAEDYLYNLLKDKES